MNAFGVEPASIVVISGLIVLVAAVLGGMVGFAYALVALPSLLLLGLPLPDVVLANLLIGMATRLGVMWRHRFDIHRTRVVLLLVGFVPGLAIGWLVRRWLPVQLIQGGAAIVAIIGAAGMVLLLVREHDGKAKRSLRSQVAPASRAYSAGVGAASGLLAVTTSLAGVPPALLLLRRADTSRTFRGELAAVLVFGNALTISLLLVTTPPPSVLTPQLLILWLALAAGGNVVGNVVADRIRLPAFRILVCAVIMVCAVSALLHAIAG